MNKNRYTITMKSYFFMHRDEKVAAFVVEGEAVLGFKVDDERREHLPYPVRDVHSFSSWLKERAIPAERYKLLGNQVSRLEFLLNNHSLSLSDNYWTCPVDGDLSWKNVNFYCNPFEATTVLDNFDEIKTIAGKTNFVPSASLKGDLAKKWIMDSEGNRFLVKGSYLPNALQAVSEVLASAMYSGCDIEYAAYSFLEISCNNEKKLGCKCKNFTKYDLEFVPAIDVISIGKKPNDRSWYTYFLEKCKEHGLDVQHFMDVMMCVDFLIANNDRHLNNFGILRNPISLQWQKMSPVFDSGNSLFYNSTTNSHLPPRKGLLKMPVTSFYKTAGEQMKCVSDPGCIDLDRLPSMSAIENMLRIDASLSEFDIEQRMRVLGGLRKIFLDFQNGAKIWGYQYQKGIKGFYR